MKKCTLLVLVCLVGMSLFAQYESSYVVFGGMTMSWASGDLSDADSKMGFHIGGSMEHFGVIPNAILETGIRFNQKGFEYSYTDYDYYWGEYSVKEEFSTNYLDIFGKIKYDTNVSLYPYVGLYAAFLLSSELKITVDGYTETWDTDDITNTVDFGLLFGIDYVLQDKFYIGVGFDLGLSNYLDIEGGFTAATRAVLISLGYYF